MPDRALCTYTRRQVADKICEPYDIDVCSLTSNIRLLPIVALQCIDLVCYLFLRRYDYAMIYFYDRSRNPIAQHFVYSVFLACLVSASCYHPSYDSYKFTTARFLHARATTILIFSLHIFSERVLPLWCGSRWPALHLFSQRTPRPGSLYMTGLNRGLDKCQSPHGALCGAI